MKTSDICSCQCRDILLGGLLGEVLSPHLYMWMEEVGTQENAVRHIWQGLSGTVVCLPDSCIDLFIGADILFNLFTF